MKYLKPLLMKTEYYEPIEKKLAKWFYEIILKPVLQILKEGDVINNSGDAIVEAINAGKIRYENGAFYGKFNSRVSKELLAQGAKFNAIKKTFEIPKSKLKPDYLFAIARYEMRLQKVSEKIVSILDDKRITGQMERLNLLPDFEKVVTKLNKNYKDIAAEIAIKPELTPAMEKQIATEWKNNLDLYIKDYTQKATLELRSKVQENVYAGNRANNLIKIIEAQGISDKAKAKFLARQETSLLVSKFRESRFTAAGITKYKWRGAMDERERPDHKALQNKIFSWNEPPVTDRKTGKRSNPGEDFGCRCIAIPVVD